MKNDRCHFLVQTMIAFRTILIMNTLYLRLKQVVIPLHQLKSVNPSTSIVNPAEKYIQVISVDDHEFWFMGFLNYEGAVTSLQDTLKAGALQSV